MTPLEADKLNKELIECKRRCDNQSEMLRKLAEKSVLQDKIIKHLGKPSTCIWWKFTAIGAIIFIVIEKLLTCL